MPNASDTEYLARILNSLEDVRKEVTKKNAGKGTSNVPGGAGVVQPNNLNASNVNVDKFAEVIKELSTAIPKLAKIDEKQYEAVAKGIKEIASALSTIKFDKKDLEGISNILTAFVQFHNVISSLADSFIKTVFKFNPLKGFVIGRVMGKFYGHMLKGMLGTFTKELIKLYANVPTSTVNIAK